MAIPSEKPSPREEGVFRDLLAGIEPFFHRAAFSYVDAGAGRGEAFRQVEDSALRPERACLIESDPRAFAALRETVRSLGADGRVSCLNVALSGAATRAGGGGDTARLDDLAESFGTDRVSLLRVGAGARQVLAGAERLLRDQRIDVIHVEAGPDPEDARRTGREVGDVLRGYGYRLFRDRRNDPAGPADATFMSGRFAEANFPHLPRDPSGLRAAEAAERRILDLERRIEEAERGRREAEDALRALRGEATESQIELARLRRYGRELEGKYADMLDSTTWRAMEPARRIMRAVRGRRAPAPFVPKLTGGGRFSPNTPERDEVDRYVRHLWGGLSAPAAAELARVLGDGRYHGDLRFEAAHKLATWHAYAGDPDAALATIRRIDEAAPEHRLSHHRLIKEGFIQLRRGDRDAARDCFERLLRARGHGRARDGVLALANCMGGDAARLAQINRVYEGTRLRGLALRDPSRPLALDNVTGLPDACDTPGLGKVSVIMPAYNAETTIRTALRSLTEQTWRDLEIIVVDDLSTDGTRAAVAEMAAADPRIVLLGAERNGGPYAARNLGLDAATGDFITTHDGDDWSHPKKIERQVAHLAANPDVMGVCTYWVRVFADFTVSSNWRIGDQTVHWSHSSFLFRRAVAERIGRWDPVRVGGDTEYIWRMRSVYGADSFKVIGQRVPLAFALDDGSSLTRAKPTHVSTINFGLRQIYRAVAEYSHASPGGAGPEGARLRRKAAPAEMFAASEGPAELDFLLMGDCASPAVVSEMRAFIESGPGRDRRTGIFHWPDFEAPGDEPCMEYCQLLTRDGVSPVLPGAPVRLASRYGVFFGTGHREIDAMPEILDSAAAPPRPAAESPASENAPPAPVPAPPPRVPAAKGSAAPAATPDALFRAGFLVCDGRTLPRSGGVHWPEVRARWTRHDLGGFLLWTDPEAGLLRRNSEKGQAVVIGDAFSVAGRSVTDAADELLRTGDWAAIADLGGRFAVLLIEGDRCRVAHDPFGSRSVFWRRGGGFAAASHAALLGDAYNHRRDRAVADFMKLRGYRDRTVKYLPGDMTVYEGIHALVPNTAYDSAEGRPRRYWPTRPRRTATMDRFMSALDRYFDAFVPFVRNRHDPVLFGITGGVDSRGVFAAFLGKGVPIEGVTWTGGYLKPAERPTVDRIVAEFGIPHRYLDLDPGADPGIAAAAAVNSGHFRGASKLTASMAMTGLPRDAVFVRGYGGEILRGFYDLPSRNPKGLGLPSERGRRGPSMTPEGLARLYSSSARGFTKEEPYAEACAGFFEGFMERAEYARLEGLGYDLRDIFYWEHRMGMWGAAMLNEMDPAVYSLVGLNGREIYETAFGLPDRERLDKALIERVVSRCHKALGAVPYS